MAVNSTTMKKDSSTRGQKHLENKMRESEPSKIVITKRGPSKITKKEAEKQLFG